jgi:hypothetical protein
MTNICFICKDEHNEIYKICQCQDSFLCEDCLTISNATNINICPICRRPLKIEYIRDKCKYFKLIIPTIGINFMSIMIPLIYPIITLKYNYSSSAILVLSLSLYCVLILQPYISYKISKELYINYNKYLLYKSIFFALTLPLIYMVSSKNRDYGYIFLLLIPLFVLPTFVVLILDLLERTNNYKIYLDKKTLIRQIQFNKILNI